MCEVPSILHLVSVARATPYCRKRIGTELFRHFCRQRAIHCSMRRCRLRSRSSSLIQCDANHNRHTGVGIANAVISMPVREFIDSDGKPWTVWNTIPDLLRGVSTPLQSGWLTFESGPDRRRLAPIPADWEEASLAMLRSYCRQARRASGEMKLRDIDRDAR